MAVLPPRGSLTDVISGKKSAGAGSSSARFNGETAAPPARLDEKSFLDGLRQDVCGTDVLRSSVEGFTRDTVALEAMMAEAQQ